MLRSTGNSPFTWAFGAGRTERGDLTVALLLVVEDEPQVLVLAEAVLKDAGHEVITATNYEGAVALLAQGNRPDAALIDHNLGEGLSGIDVAKSARSYCKGMKIIYTSGDHVSDGTRALFVEGSDFLPKPYTPEQLTEAIERILLGPSG
jgi:DNA-binding response OmpR family regulator